MGAPGGIAAAFLDVNGHIRQMGQSVQSILQVHFSSNDINHDQLDQQIEFKRTKLVEHEAKLDQASNMVATLRAFGTDAKQQLWKLQRSLLHWMGKSRYLQ